MVLYYIGCLASELFYTKTQTEVSKLLHFPMASSLSPSVNSRSTPAFSQLCHQVRKHTCNLRLLFFSFNSIAQFIFLYVYQDTKSFLLLYYLIPKQPFSPVQMLPWAPLQRFRELLSSAITTQEIFVIIY